jgi:hypothetical protein
MILIYKSCIFCDTIFDASVPHICNTCPDEGKNKIDTEHPPSSGNEESEQDIIMDENKRLIKRTVVARKAIRTISHTLKEETESTDEDESATITTISPSIYHIRNTKNKAGGYGSLKKKRTQTHSITHSYTHVPSQIELYELVMQLSKKCETLQNEVASLKTKFSTRLKRDIADYLQYDQRPAHTFLEWVTSFDVTDEILHMVFDTDLTEGVKKCIDDRITEEGVYSVPIRVFKEKPDYIFIYTNEPIVIGNGAGDDWNEMKKNEEDGHTRQITSEGGGGEPLTKVKCVPVDIRLGVNPKELLKTPTWRMVSKNSFTRVKEYVAEHILKKFYLWEKENEPNMIHSTEKMDMLTSYTLKVIGHGSKCKRERQNAELYKWFFSKMAIS